MMHFKVVKFDINHKNEWDTLAELNWGEHTDTDYDLKNNFFATPDYVVEARSNNDLVGIILLDLREVFIGSHTLNAGMIGGVVVKIDHRHRGIAHQMLEEAINFLKNRNIDLALLCTDVKRLGVLYQKAGFTALKKPYVYTDKTGATCTEAGGMVRGINTDSQILTKMIEHDEINIGLSNF
ncbi:GNAT family N-acetyltransferase [Candidatus Woesebacteria bacterium]|nr:GNAT family N-acetyltransferase [Candidatus Woesebacteria bacterium]